MRARTVKPPAERFFAKVTQDGDCWVWTGAVMSNGYGRFGLGRRGEGRVLVHRWAYEQLVADIPAGLVLDHLCRRPACVNPAHLEPVPQRVNVLRGDGPRLLSLRRRAAGRVA